MVQRYGGFVGTLVGGTRSGTSHKGRDGRTEACLLLDPSVQAAVRGWYEGDTSVVRWYEVRGWYEGRGVHHYTTTQGWSQLLPYCLLLDPVRHQIAKVVEYVGDQNEF